MHDVVRDLEVLKGLGEERRRRVVGEVVGEVKPVLAVSFVFLVADLVAVLGGA